MKQISIKNEFLSLKVLDYGAIIQELTFYPKDRPPIPLVVGFEDPEGYRDDKACLGACVGRFAGRISGGFELDGRYYPLHTVVKNVHLHGGAEGFQKKFWMVEEVVSGTEPAILLAYTSPHMEEGYPGRLRATVSYRLSGRSLHIRHQATTDQKTVVNLVNHSYFLFGQSPSLREYQLQLQCSNYVETLENLLPTGRILPVEGTDYDFRQARVLHSVHLDTPFVTDPKATEVARIYDPVSGMRMQVRTNQPGLVVYTPRDFAGICFETQNLPDAPNMAQFPSSVLQEGSVYENATEFLFNCEAG